MRTRLLSFVIGLGIGVSPALAGTRPVVVELFTSEGCSSCPPADAFLTDLARERPDVLPLAFHVTYWNSLGWRDPFSLESATDRQVSYSSHVAGNSVFTPQMIVDGARSLVGSDRDEGRSAIEAAKSASATGPSVGVTREGNRLSISVGKGSGAGRVLLIGFDHQHRTAIGRGENSGRTLVESNIVRSLRVVGDWTGAAIRIAEDIPAGDDAAVLLQAPNGHVIGAARLDMSS